MKARTKTDMPIKKLILAASSAQSSLEKSATIQNIFIKSQKVSTTAISIETISLSKYFILEHKYFLCLVQKHFFHKQLRIFVIFLRLFAF